MAKHRAKRQPLFRLSKGLKRAVGMLAVLLISGVVLYWGFKFVPPGAYQGFSDVPASPAVDPSMTASSPVAEPSSIPAPEPTEPRLPPSAALTSPVLVIKVVTLLRGEHNIRSAPTTVGNTPLRQVRSGFRLDTVELIVCQDPYNDGRNKWLKLADNTFMWSGNTDADQVYAEHLPLTRCT